MTMLRDLSPLTLLLLRVTVVALIGRLLMAAMARASAASRYLVAVTTFVSMLVIPLIYAAGVEWRLAVFPPPTVSAPAITTAETSTSDAVWPASQLVASAAPAAEWGSLLRQSWRGWLLLLAGAVGAAFAGRMLFGLMAIRAITARAREIEDDAVIRDFEVAAERLGVSRMVRLLASERVAVPLVWGIVRPVLLHPAAARQWDRERLRVVFLHELAHLRRRNPMTLLLTRAAAALYWFHPLAWSLDRAARRDCELACDDLVLASGTRASDYADHLLGIARSLPRHDPFGAVTLAMSRRSQLEGRLLSILDPHARREHVSRRGAAVAAVLAALLVLPLSAIRLTAQTAPPAKRANGSRNAEEWYSIGKQLFHEEDYARAADAFGEAVRLDPFAGSAWYNMACAQARSGDRRALDTLEQALLHNFSDGGEKLLTDDDLESLHGARLDELARLADDLQLHNDGDDWADAIDRYARLARQHPNIARAWFNYGFALVEGGQPRQGVDAFNRALQAGYRPGTVMYNLGCAYALMGDRQQALSWLMKAENAGFAVGEFAKGDKDLDNVRNERWLAERIAEARGHDKHK